MGQRVPYVRRRLSSDRVRVMPRSPDEECERAGLPWLKKELTDYAVKNLHPEAFIDGSATRHDRTHTPLWFYVLCILTLFGVAWGAAANLHLSQAPPIYIARPGDPL